MEEEAISVSEVTALVVEDGLHVKNFHVVTEDEVKGITKIVCTKVLPVVEVIATVEVKKR